MKEHKALLDTAAQVVHLDSPMHDIHVLQLSSSSVATPSVHHTAAHNKEDIHVAYEFPIIFPKDLPGMPKPLNYNPTPHLSPDGHTR
jgi:hypothetical protein